MKPWLVIRRGVRRQCRQTYIVAKNLTEEEAKARAASLNTDPNFVYYAVREMFYRRRWYA